MESRKYEVATAVPNYLAADQTERHKQARKTLKKSQWYKHRSTWMMVVLLLLLILLILALTVAPPALGVLLMVFGITIGVVKVVSYFIAVYDVSSQTADWIVDAKNPFTQLKTWLVEHTDQAIIAGVGIVLSVVGLGLMLGLSSIIAPALTLACGCWGTFLVFNLVVLGPVTIADAVNNYLDRRDAEKALEQDGGEYEPVSEVRPNESQGLTDLQQKKLEGVSVTPVDTKTGVQLEEAQGTPPLQNKGFH